MNTIAKFFNDFDIILLMELKLCEMNSYCLFSLSGVGRVVQMLKILLFCLIQWFLYSLHCHPNELYFWKNESRQFQLTWRHPQPEHTWWTITKELLTKDNSVVECDEIDGTSNFILLFTKTFSSCVNRFDLISDEVIISE